MKKRILFLFAIASCIISMAQPPQSINYQAVVRDNTGELVINQAVSFRIKILIGSPDGSSVFTETHQITTNQFGLAKLEIGRGNAESGIFEEILWGSSTYFLAVEVDITGNANYQYMGTSQLLTVPYSLNSGSLTVSSPDGTSYEVKVDNNGNISTNCIPYPTVANAGPNQLNALSPTILQGNTPLYGEGRWKIEEGEGGIIAEPWNPESSFAGIPEIPYTLSWGISTPCDTSVDNKLEIFFTGNSDCPATVNDIDGNTYNVVQLGDLCWMKENLATTTYRDGTPIPNVTDNTDWKNLTTGAYSWFENDISRKEEYGALYNWYVLEQGNGLCPAGWHVPTQAEFSGLSDFIGNPVNEQGKKLKSCRQVGSPLGGDCNISEHPRWNFNSTHFGTDDYGFACLPGGRREVGDEAFFTGLGESGAWWSSTKDYNYSPVNAFLRIVESSSDYFYQEQVSLNWGFSVRCLRDYGGGGNNPPQQPENQSPQNGANGQSIINTALNWQCSDQDGDDLTYRIYLSSSNPPSLYSEGITETMFTPDPGFLLNSTTYYWKVSASDGVEWSSGETWSFSTQQNDAPEVEWAGMSGQAEPGYSVFAEYSYYDADGDAEGETLFQWYRADNIEGLNQIPITGAENNYYIVQEPDAGKFISVEITPAAQTGYPQVGEPEMAQYRGPVFAGCGSPMVDLRDGQTYNTVQIGNQCWMSENLNVGEMIPSSQNQSYSNAVIEKYCYENTESNCEEYGGLYMWREAVMNFSTGSFFNDICPTGWTCPEDADLDILFMEVDVATNYWGTGWYGIDAGGNLKESGYSHWQAPNTGATNSSGFTALPGGKYQNGAWGSLFEEGYFWSSTQGGLIAHLVVGFKLSRLSPQVYINTQEQTDPFAYSVRCLKQ